MWAAGPSTAAETDSLRRVGSSIGQSKIASPSSATGDRFGHPFSAAKEPASPTCTSMSGLADSACVSSLWDWERRWVGSDSYPHASLSRRQLAQAGCSLPQRTFRRRQVTQLSIGLGMALSERWRWLLCVYMCILSCCRVSIEIEISGRGVSP
jgi:hypothetical protein